MAGKARQSKPKAGGQGSANSRKNKNKNSLSLNRAPGQPTIEDQLVKEDESKQESILALQSDIEVPRSDDVDQNEIDDTNSALVSTENVESEPSSNDVDHNETADTNSAPASTETVESETSVQECVDEPAFTRKKAVDVIERFFTVLVMAHVSPQVAIRSATNDEQPLTIEQFEQSMRNMGLEHFQLVPTEIRALRVLQNAQGTGIDTQALCDQANAITFRVEMCEFQIRSAVCTDKASSGKPTRGKIDVQRIVRRLLTNIPAESDGNEASNSGTITSKQFEVLLATKLAITPGSFLTRILFARIIRRPFQRNFPRILEESRDTFCESLELFCTENPLSIGCVEGQLRSLVNKHPDLRQAFQDLDTDSSGSISRQEFITFLQREAQMQVPEETLSAFLKRFDMDGDGTLSYEEFAEFAHPKQFGIQVLSPFGLFYLGVNRLETMRNVVEKIKTRLFWLQHTDLFAVSSASAAVRTRANGAPSYSTSRPMTSSNQQPRLKLKVTERFVLTHHFGTLRLQFKQSDRICSVLSNGEMVVLLMVSDSPEATAINNDRREQRDEISLPFEYRLKPNSKRRIPALFSTTQAMAQQEKLRSSSTSQVTNNAKTELKNLQVRRLRGSSALSSPANSSKISSTDALPIDHRFENESINDSESQYTPLAPDKQSPMQSADHSPAPALDSPREGPAAPATASRLDASPSPLETDSFAVFEDSDADEDEDEQIVAAADDVGDEMIAPRDEPEYPAAEEEEDPPPPYE